MSDDVGNGFLRREKHIVPDLRGNGGAGQLGRHIQPVADAGHGEVFLGALANVSNQTIQRIVGRVDCPNDFIEGLSGFTRRLGDLSGMRFHFFRRFLIALDQLAQQRNLSEAGAELIVDVSRNPCALLFDRLLLS